MKGLAFNCDHSTFREILGKDHSTTIHYGNLHSLAVEICKVKNDVALRLWRIIQAKRTHI